MYIKIRYNSWLWRSDSWVLNMANFRFVHPSSSQSCHWDVFITQETSNVADCSEKSSRHDCFVSHQCLLKPLKIQVNQFHEVRSRLHPGLKALAEHLQPIFPSVPPTPSPASGMGGELEDIEGYTFVYKTMYINNHRSSGFRSNHWSFIATVLFRMVRKL